MRRMPMSGWCRVAPVAAALLASNAAVSNADLVDYEIRDLEIKTYQSACTASVPTVNQPTCIVLTIRNNGPNFGQGSCGCTVRFQDPAGEVMIVEPQSINVVGQDVVVTLSNHTYHPTQAGIFSVSCTLRPSSPADGDADLTNNSRTEIYEVVAGAPIFTCTYDSIAHEVHYGVSGASSSAVYSVAGAATQSVGIPATLPNLVGPSSAAAVAVSCLGAGQGSATITISEGQSVVSRTFFCFECSGFGSNPSAHCAAPQQIPALGPLAIGLATLLIAAAAHRRLRSGA